MNWIWKEFEKLMKNKIEKMLWGKIRKYKDLEKVHQICYKIFKMNNFSSQFANYYELLGIASTASQKEIKQAYIKKVKEWHPDKNPDRRAEAEEKTKILNQAYHLLSDPAGRKNYDRMLRYT